MWIGPYKLENRVIAAPMAGVTDLPFRRLCKRLGASLVVAEMISANPRLRHTRKSRLRLVHRDESSPRAIQIAGSKPHELADAARYNVDLGAQIVDINMGLSAKKVCGAAAGSALLEDEVLVERILRAVVDAVDVPITLKIRTGPTPARRNALEIARIAQECGIAALTIHGRTRSCAFRGDAEFATIAEVKSRVHIPIIANGDIDSAPKALAVLRQTGADAIMIGRAAQGNPWIFSAIAGFLESGVSPQPPSIAQTRAILIEHLNALYSHYGESQGVKIARKHLGWYCRARPGGDAFWSRVNQVEHAHEQLQLVEQFLGASELGVEQAVASRHAA